MNGDSRYRRFDFARVAFGSLAAPTLAALAAGLIGAALGPDAGALAADDAPRLVLHTFSICALDPATGETGVAVTTRVPEVGRLCPFARAGVGAVATQSHVEVSYGPRGLDLLEQGRTPAEAIEMLLRDDPHRETRQLGIIDARGNAAQFTGSACHDFAGHFEGRHFVVQGNLLAGRAVIEAFAERFESTADANWPLADRLIGALEAGQAAGGDKRTGLKQSAAMVVADPRATFLDGSHLTINLQVAEHAEPVAELRRQFEAIHARPGYRELRWLEGDDVAELRRWLRELGYFDDGPTAAEGRTANDQAFDAATADAVDRFRAAHGLPTPADGLGHGRGVVDRVCVDKLKQELIRQRQVKRRDHSEGTQAAPGTDGDARSSRRER